MGNSLQPVFLDDWCIVDSVVDETVNLCNLSGHVQWWSLETYTTESFLSLQALGFTPMPLRKARQYSMKG